MKKQIMLCVIMYLPTFVQAADIEGKLDWYKTFPVSSLLSGRIDQVAVFAGQKVDKGAFLLSIDKSYHQQQLTAARTGLQKAKAQRDEAGRELERTQTLFEQTLIANHEFDLVKVADQQAQAAYEQAQAVLQQAELNMAQSVINAPFAARVLRVSVQSQQMVNNQWQSPPMMWLASLDAMLVHADISAQQARRLASVRRLAVRIGDKRYQGEVEGITYTAEKNYQLSLRLAASSGAMLAGMTAIIELP